MSQRLPGLAVDQSAVSGRARCAPQPMPRQSLNGGRNRRDAFFRRACGLGANRQEDPQWRLFSEGCDQLFTRWRLESLAGPYLPVPLPLLLGGTLPLSVVQRLMQAGGLFYLPDAVQIPSRDELRTACLIGRAARSCQARWPAAGAPGRMANHHSSRQPCEKQKWTGSPDSSRSSITGGSCTSGTVRRWSATSVAANRRWPVFSG